MTSPAQIDANRHNATRSTGPRSDAGKAAVARNAVKHSLAGHHVVLAHEDSAEFDQFSDELTRELYPGSPHESSLLTIMAQSRWRLARLRRLETAALNSVLGSAGLEDPDAKLAQSLIGHDGDPLAKIERYAAAAERSYYKAFRLLWKPANFASRNKWPNRSVKSG